MDSTPAEILERSQWDFFWVPPDTTVHERPELLYVTCPRDLPHLNCVTRTRGAPPQIDDLVREVVDAHRRVRSRWHVPDTFDVRPLEAALQAAGYVRAVEHHAYVQETATFRARTRPPVRVQRVERMDELRALHRAFDLAFGVDRSRSEEDARIELAQCRAADGRVHRFVAYDQAGEPVACGGLTVFAHLRFGFLWAGGTIPGARGRGYYSAVLAARIAKARALGLRCVGVYARVETSSPIVAAHGLARIGNMSFWDRAQ